MTTKEWKMLGYDAGEIAKEFREASMRLGTPGLWPVTLLDLDRKILCVLDALEKRTKALEMIDAVSDPEDIDREWIAKALEDS